MRQVWHQMFLRLPMADSVQRAHKDRSSKTRAKQSKHKRRNVCYIQSMWSFQHRRRGSFCLSQDLFCPAPLLWTYPCGQPPPCYSCRNLQVQNSTCFAINGLLHRCIQSWSGYHSHERNSLAKVDWRGSYRCSSHMVKWSKKSESGKRRTCLFCIAYP